MAHDYTSTACQHEGEDSSLHNACRQTCKFCGTRCRCPGHADSKSHTTTGWVDQARDMARELLNSGQAWHCVPRPLLDRIENDPDLFWLRT